MARRPDWVKPVETSKGRRYEVRVHGQRPDGSRFQNKKRFETVEAAVKWRSTVVSELAHGTHVSPSGLTVRQAADAWLAAQRIRASTREGYVANLRPLVDALGGRTVQSVTKADIESLVTSLLAGGSSFGDWHAPEKLVKAARMRRNPLAPRTINSCLIRVRAVFDDLVQQGTLVRNPAALVKSLPVTRPELSTLDADQAATLMDATADDCFHIAWRLALSGLRRGEILALRWASVDFTANTVTIDAARLAVSGGSSTGATKTKSSERTLPMPPDLAAALKREAKRQKELRLRLGSKWPNSGLVVVDELGTPPHPDTLSKAWREALANADLPAVRLHDARHSCATLMHLDGVPAVVIAAWLGHTDARFTLSVYAHANDNALADAAASLSKVTGRRPAEKEAR
ncbi:gp41 protein [Mycobacteroides abscessus subsp. abscessus]|uniref:site-specific integrase n=1 Tax=Mycobacteroides abscessus TaxID=36809 RepID=UPI00092B0067|nr:site-specific integrase [Mycobacteroides abscessus]SHP29545.1 gp41 protein [Mycobacteroides abscessus subsp. abscessus]SHP69997.1 gp41 protein [Mycobacteroides abscessus subsp. abscessus]SHY39788.1 gp41 protein [Mycobacteroides abscessus subsp. abscessus]SKD92591.1 gp41 protein [Mycobacteroides abscessus subsp. abscessus]